MTQPKLQSPVPAVSHVLLSFPTPQILLVTLNRPAQLNCVNMRMNYELDALFTWLDGEPSLRCAIITGRGRAFCAGADLKEWDQQGSDGGGNRRSGGVRRMPSSGFGGLSRRAGRKPVIGAINGICFGGGCEIAINLDLVIAAQKATFALPEVKRGVVALAGALPRLVRTVGRQRAMEMALTGRTVGAAEAERWGLVNRVVGDAGEGPESEVVKAAIKLAEEVAENSPDSVIVSREGIKYGWEGVGADEGTSLLMENWYSKMDQGQNMVEGIRAFVEKRKPKWVASKL
ncbi:MAG: hypothetical protein M1818_003579 [Claussenomyces sp. TS43310]|nr:MAG: hypothetical protein M1818_003579 [Claussenomyces sp. TS43310]